MLRRFYPAVHGRYHEPFLGSGAVFFDLASSHRLTDGATLADDNIDLVACYRYVARSVEALIAVLEQMALEHRAGGREFYLRVRDDRFNPMRAAWRARGGILDDYPIELAAMLLYLNRTGYNGLFRLNASGVFNVPPGRYDSPRVVNPALLRRAAQILGGQAVRIDHAPFTQVLEAAQPGDFVYLDPPYSPMSKTANFRAYTSRGFTAEQQTTLQRVVVALAARGVHVLLSNSVAPEITELYEGNADVLHAGLTTYRFPARRAVNSRPDRRGTVDELLVSNVVPHTPDDYV